MSNDLPAYDQARLVAALGDPARFGEGCRRVVHIETHISHVFLTGAFAYKIKKPVDLGFLDFTALDRRRHYCGEELRLNRRLAPELYLAVVAITGSVDDPVVDGDGPAIEYAIKMREFPQDALASRLLARGLFTDAHVDALAARVAAFHAGIAVAPASSLFGSPATVLGAALQNFEQIRPHVADAADRVALDAVEAWTRSEFAARGDGFGQRQATGFVRECHGDLHLGNIAVFDDTPTVFDCIEFNDAFRWIDTMSEVAFTAMDLDDRGRPDFAHRFVNAYLESTGDYPGLGVLRFYLAYRAMVRAKVACLREAQLSPGAEQDALAVERRGYVDLARQYAQPTRGGLAITHGLSGSGKTTLTQALLERCGAVRVRTDIERKRLHGLAAMARTGDGVEAGLYAAAATERTYRRALALAEAIVATGRIAIVDGAFLKRWQRDLFRERALALDVPFAAIEFSAREATLRSRLTDRARRATDASDADLAVLEHQLRTRDPIAADERAWTVRYDAEAPLERAREASAWEALLARLGVATVSSKANSGRT